MIDTERMAGGAELAAELRGGEGGGIPWMVILDGEGAPVITSDGPKGNVGCPAQPHEIDYFLEMVDGTRRHMADDERAVLARELRAYGAELIRPRRDTPGWGEYRDAVAHVKYGAFDAAVRDLGRAVESGYSAEALLVDANLRPLREDPDRRLELFDLLKQHVHGSEVQMVDDTEPGRRIRLVGRVVDKETGEPLGGALMQLFHTDAGGEYRPGMDAGGGAGNPRLFAYLRTDERGGFTVDTIMPERYPNSSVPRHVHYRVWVEGYPTLESECFFDSDPNLSDRTRETAPQRNFPIVVMERDAEQHHVGTLTVKVPKQ